tara:strand:- start:222095 stop:224032 length:1938 start_codon:yes stop_codon:yes gene_type:complete
MCGITGIFDIGARDVSHIDVLREMTRAMSDRLTHRGPDSSGVWGDEQTPLTLGHRRLAIVDLSTHGDQPMHSQSGRYVVAYNGEIYNFLEMRRNLEDAGHSFKGHSDTEVLLAAIEHWGINTAVQKINGMFAIALWDRQSQELHLLRDRFGKKPLYIGWAEQQIVFGSELKAFAAHPDFQRNKAINPDVLALYMRLSYVPAPHCIFKNVWSLPAGQRITLKYGEINAGLDLSSLFEIYFDAGAQIQNRRAEIDPKMGFDDALSGLDHVMHKAVERRMISDVPIGAFLSGGIDSSLVVAMMQEQMNERVKTFSIGFNEPKYNEAEHAKAIATHLGTDHHEYYVDSNAVKDSLALMADIYDEPFADASQIPTFMVAREASKDVSVVLTGDGGDEMFAGYKRHYQGAQVWRKMRLLPAPLRRGLQKLLLKTLPVSLQCQNDRINRLVEVMGSRDLNDFYNGLSQQWHNTEALVHESTDVALLNQDIRREVQGLKPEEQMVYWDVLSQLSDRMMVKVDRATMASSIESRAPFMDVDVFDYAWTLPLQTKIHAGQGKYVVRELLARYLPRHLYERPKQGFTPPLNAWLNGDLKPWVDGLVHDKAAPANAYFDLSLIASAWRRAALGSEADTLRIWNFVMFHLWHKRWMSS